jgi:hypothetical protein
VQEKANAGFPISLTVRFLLPSSLFPSSTASSPFFLLSDTLLTISRTQDIWGRAIALHFLNGTTEDNFYSTSAAHDQGTQFSSIRLTQNFQAGAMPFPLLVTTSRVSEQMQLEGNSTTVLPLSNTQFEITPFSFGSFDATLSARVPIEYLGTAMSNGAVTNTCVNYFEAASFMMGSSASLFNSVQQDERVSQVRCVCFPLWHPRGD